MRSAVKANNCMKEEEYGLELSIDVLRKLCGNGRILWKEHAAKRMKQRSIKTDDVEHCIATGEIIEVYDKDYPAPSFLLLGLSVKAQPLHVVCSIYQETVCIITTYFPNPNEWESDFKTRKAVE